MKRNFVTLLLCVLYLTSYAQPDACTGASNLNPGTSCTVTSNQTLESSSATGSPNHATYGAVKDVWYRFTTPSGISSVVITLSSPGNGIDDNTYIEAFSGGACNSGTFTGTSLGTSAVTTGTGTSLTVNGLNGSTEYYFRVFTTSSTVSGNPVNQWKFGICVTYTALPTLSGPNPTRMNEVFQETVIANNAAGLDSPWEITYEDQEDSLWITENKTYLIRKMSPSTGQSRVILNLSETGSFSSFRRTFSSSQNPWPQGGMMGFAIHPQFLAASNAKNYVYVAYVRAFVGAGPANGFRNRTATNPNNGEAVKGDLFTTFVVRFDYNTTTKALENPVALCDTITGSNDHNSGRLLIAPVNGTDYLFYSVGDMGAGQFYSSERTIKSELTNSYEGKILRFNLETDNESGLDQWIPNDNPYNNTAPVTGQSAVWSIGHRNVQGLAYMNSMLFGSSHGPFSDDELNVLEAGKHYGHPRIVGYKDGNYNNARAATATFAGWSNEFSSNPLVSSLPLVTDEANTTIANFKAPIFSFFDAANGSTSTSGTVLYLYANNPSNSGWPSIAPSGMGAYTNNKIPGWKNSLILASLKRGYMMRLKPTADGSDVEAIGGADTSAIFNTQNRFRDLAFDPDGYTIYGAIDRSGSTSGPTSTTPVSSTCPGCIIKYKFVGYNHSGGTSTIPTSIPIDAGTLNNCVTGSSVTINATNLNTNLWVPLTGPDGNIVAEINANGNSLGNVTSSFFVRSGAARTTASSGKYLNRNITISVQNQPASNVSVRLYLTATELQDLINTVGSGVTSINDIGVFKNSDACGSSMSATATSQTITGRYTQSTYGHAVQADIGSFSTFYFMSTSSTLPANIISFTATGAGDAAKLQWTVEEQQNVERYIVERSSNNISFTAIGSVEARGTANEKINYLFTDANAAAIAATVYYRIKITDKDGSAKYTNVVPVSFEAYTRAFVTVQPNPVVNNATVLVMSAAEETVQLRVTDNTGRTVMSKNILLTKGRNTLDLNVSSLPSGLYYLDVVGKNINQKTKLIKQ
ncbi:T9SS type A sorting domain-containing protein [Lacibacter luteus]|uniref:T9SS type A sorting domain-containing protein n=1 Tax=Lacibacter luteus TaxID=2508719 RepID=A0A4Q1CGX6_9BACT|nr:PQQ-dependent sugar dehydrogenase [Lacibacter luteus]RXK59313.1 T9SS type A sorting domain-containing protein [Lacibacter luteus]